MSVEIFNNNDGYISKIIVGKTEIPFVSCGGPRLFCSSGFGKREIPTRSTENGLCGIENDISCNIKFEKAAGAVKITVTAKNLANTDIDKVTLRLGIDTEMDTYPLWNNKFFPTMLRCEKTHFWGYMMSPVQKCFALLCPQPIASYGYEYKMYGEHYFGHRIMAVDFDLINKGVLPKRNPRISFCVGETHTWEIYIAELDSPEAIHETAFNLCGIPLIGIERTILQQNEDIRFFTNCQSDGIVSITAPNGSPVTGKKVQDYGLYTVTLKYKEFQCEGSVYVRKPYSFYLKNARRQAIENPQKATTHAESWYGFYSGFLAAQHYPDKKMDDLLSKSFDEIIPYAFDTERIKPLLIPERIQNTATFIGILVSRYKSDKDKYLNDLILASRFGDWLIKKQGADGAFYRDKTQHYTCVIYIAKSLLELAIAEREALPEAGKRHYAAVTRAIDNLVELLERIGTEGESTLEDGMLSCSALQIGMYALTLPCEKRERYIKAAEHMMSVHACLEQNIIPDARMRGGSLRFWEAQFDVLAEGNMFSSPHGWTAWTAYALYYLYMLCGKREYLIRLINTMGACLQLMSLDGKLRWGFICDPQVKTRVFEPNIKQPVKDGYKYVGALSQAYRGKFADKIIGEEYLDMISGWYRMGERRVCGGFIHCPLILEDREEDGDNQGGCCDNDVHEVFKCLEETLLKKAFVLENDDGELEGFGCDVYRRGNVINVLTDEDIEFIHINIKEKADIAHNGKLIKKNIFGQKMLRKNGREICCL